MRTAILLLLTSSVLVFCYDPEYYENSTCPEGTCRKVSECWAALPDIANHNLSQCGFVGFIQIVCCPPEGGMRSLDFGKIGEKSKKYCEEHPRNVTPQMEYQIAGGQDVQQGDFPFMAALYVYDVTQKQYSFTCGATLISDRFVVTSAHCFKDLEDESFMRLGTVNATKFLKERDEHFDYAVEKVTIHPQYNRKKRRNDIALVQLKKKVNLQPACLAANSTVSSGDYVILGWGEVDNEKNPRTDTLQKGFVKFLNTDECEERVGRRKKLKLASTQICAHSEESDTCRGDSGGPLLTHFSNVLVGVANFGLSVCTPGFPSVYESVHEHLYWIEKTVWPEETSDWVFEDE